MAARFGIEKAASIEIITRRVFDAVVDLQLIAWPTLEDKAQLLAESSDTLPYCLGIIDATLSPLKFSPTLNHELFLTGRGSYAVKWQVICDMKKRVRHIKAVLHGSIYNSSMYKATGLHQRSMLYFKDMEYIIGDSGYPLSPTCVTLYEDSSQVATPEHRRKFNQALNKYRVRAERCIRDIKRRFSSLNLLPIEIRSEDDLAFCSRWVSVAAMLHNFAISHGESVNDEDIGADDDVELALPSNTLRQNWCKDKEEIASAGCSGEQKRMWLYKKLFGGDE